MNIHSQNRDKLVEFLKTDLVGPMTDNKSLDFDELDTSKKIVFNNTDEAFFFLKTKKQEKKYFICPKGIDSIHSRPTHQVFCIQKMKCFLLMKI